MQAIGISSFVAAASGSSTPGAGINRVTLIARFIAYLRAPKALLSPTALLCRRLANAAVTSSIVAAMWSLAYMYKRVRAKYGQAQLAQKRPDLWVADHLVENCEVRRQRCRPRGRGRATVCRRLPMVPPPLCAWLAAICAVVLAPALASRALSRCASCALAPPCP